MRKEYLSLLTIAYVNMCGKLGTIILAIKITNVYYKEEET
jgi:hypothetical protein